MINIKIILLLSLTAYVWCSGNNESNRNDNINRKGKGKRNNISGLRSDFLSGFMDNFMGDDEDFFRPTHHGKGKSQAEQTSEQNASGSHPSRAYGNSQAYAGGGSSYNSNSQEPQPGVEWNNMFDDFPRWMKDKIPPTVPTGMPMDYNRDSQSRTYDYGNRYANRGMPPRTDNVSENIRRPGGSREGSSSVNIQSADVRGGGETRGYRGPNVDMTGDNFTIDGKNVTGSSVQFTNAGVYVDGKLDPKYGKGAQ
ncbi:uncharacterized protein LOC126847795 [Adelges cooleyi]|uniref:uncharacterized protein LOC126847795 n=1 Tax=Adelges cooleyi TaxID=133065 RepID=UPI00217FA7D9|nr:uncharacterized protein LOC126847795 [Adelges cooleyi]